MQNHQPADFADQQHIFGMNIKNHFSIFHSHPSLEKSVNNQSPNYWVGYGHFPHVAQDKNVNLSIYNIPEKKGMMEADLLGYTHAYFPSQKFDTTLFDGKYVFGKKGETYCVFIGLNNFEYRDEAKDDIIQKGKQTFWITEASSKIEDGSFEVFIQRIKNNKVSFNSNTLELSYQSNDKHYELEFDSDFNINGKVIDTNYKRYDSPYVKAKKKDKTITFEYNAKTLYLDFENMIRKF